MADSLSQLANNIEQTLFPDAATRRNAESFLASNENQPQFVVLIFQLISSDIYPPHVRQAAAVYLKNLTGRIWADLPENDRNQIKSILIDIMLSVPIAVRRQMNQVLANVAKFEFPANWKSLLPDLMAKLTQACSNPSGIDWSTCHGILETMDALFDRYRHEYRTDELFSEINYVLNEVQKPILICFKNFSEIIFSGSFNVSNAQAVFSVLELVLKIFFSLSWQDLPEFFEDNLAEFMPGLLKLLSYENPAIEENLDDDEPSFVDKIQAAVIEVANLYESKYEEEFRKYLPDFVSATWTLLVKRGNAPKYDKIATTGITFLTTVSRSADFALFSNPQTLRQICENIVIVNIELRDDEEELFEDNPVEYIRRDLEGSDAETRRKAASELVKGLCMHFEQPVTEAFGSYINAMLGQYASNPAANWKSKDAAIYVITALIWKGGTKTSGATSTSSLVNVVDFFQSHIISELRNAASSPTNIVTPILTADAIKFTTTFRNQLSKETFGEIVTLCTKLLGCPLRVIHSYASVCIERLLTCKISNPSNPGSKIFLLSENEVSSFLPSLLSSIFSLIGPGKPENEYIMRCLLRITSVAQENMAPSAQTTLQFLCQTIEFISKNPSNPLFNHYVFETIASLARFVIPTTPDGSMLNLFESLILPPFQMILSLDISEFGPYVFQILSQLLELHRPNQHIAESYAALLGPLLSPTLWDRSGYIPGMVQYLEAFILQSPAVISSNGHLGGIFGIFQKLVSSKANDQYGMELLTIIVQSYKIEQLQPFLSELFKILMIRLQTAKTSKFVQKLIYFMSVFTTLYGGDVLISCLDGLQKDLMVSILGQVWLPNGLLLISAKDRKACVIGLSSLLTSDKFLGEPYISQIGPLITTAVAVLEGINLNNDNANEHDDDDDDQVDGYNVSYSQLAWTGSDKKDPFRTVDEKNYLAESVEKSSSKRPGMLNPIIRSCLEAGAQQALAKYMAAAGKQIN